jgi:hypothetical protein
MLASICLAYGKVKARRFNNSLGVHLQPRVIQQTAEGRYFSFTRCQNSSTSRVSKNAIASITFPSFIVKYQVYVFRYAEQIDGHIDHLVL